MDLVRSEHESEVVLGLVEVRDEDRFVFGPSTSCYEESPSVERLHLWYLLGCPSDGLDTVEAGIPRDTDLSDAVLEEEILRMGILYVEVTEEIEQSQVPAPVPAEEELVFSEDGRDEVGRHFPPGKLPEHRRPEVVLDEDSDVGAS